MQDQWTPEPRSDAHDTSRPRLAGDVAAELGIGVQTLHFYEREGLIPPPPRTAAGYRVYTPAIVGRVGFIRKAQALGLPLQEIREILQLAEQGGCPCGRVQGALAGKLAEVDRRMRELRAFRRELAALVQRGTELAAACDPGEICSIVEHAPPLPHVAQLTDRLVRSREPRRRRS